MRKRYKILIGLISLLLIICIYFNTNYYIKAHEWKHSKKATIGDWLDFKNSAYTIKDRKIYKNNLPVGKIVFCFESYLVIEVKDQDEFGYYYKKK